MNKVRPFGSPRKTLYPILAGMLIILAACAGQPAQAPAAPVKQAAPAVVKIGALAPLTGPMAGYAEAMKLGIELAVEDINNGGGIKAVGGAKVEIAWADHQMKPDVAAGESERLIEQEKVVAFVDHPPSAISMAASQVAERLKTPILMPISFADALTERGFQYAFELEPTAYYVAKTQVQWLDALGKQMGRKLTRVGLIHEDTDYGQSLGRGQKKNLEELGGYEVVADLSYPANAPDVTSVVSKLKDAKPDAVLQASYLADSVLIRKTFDRLGLDVPTIDASGKATVAYLDGVAGLAEGEFVLNMWAKDMGPAAAKLNERYKAKANGKDMVSAAALEYQAIIVLKEAIEKAGSADRDAVRKALTEIDIPAGSDKLIMPYERIKFNEKGLNTFGSYIMSQIQGRDFVTIFPDKFASGQAKIKDAWKK